MEAHVTAGSPTGDPPAAPTLVVAPGDPKPEQKDDASPLLRINGTDYDLTDLTLNEEEEVETLCGGEKELWELNLNDRRTLKALSFVFLKRTDPDLTFAQAGNVKRKGIFSAINADAE